VGDILRTLSVCSPLGEQLEQALIWERWPEIAGDPLYMHARPVSIKKSQLKVEAESSVWMNRLAFRKETIIRNINRLAKRRIVQDLFLALQDDERAQNEEDG
jgi:predicted nucleic acid-binding Zn ribbon protein